MALGTGIGRKREESDKSDKDSFDIARPGITRSFS